MMSQKAIFMVCVNIRSQLIIVSQSYNDDITNSPLKIFTIHKITMYKKIVKNKQH